MALAGVVAGATMLAGVLVQPLRRRAGSRSAAAGLALGGAGVALCIASVSLSSWLVLLPAGSLLGMAYGLCLAGGLTEVEALADRQTRGALTAMFYVLTYVGTGAPFAVTELSRAVGATATFSAAWLFGSPGARARTPLTVEAGTALPDPHR